MGLQLICVLGLDFLLWVVLGTKTQWDHFSLPLVYKALFLLFLSVRALPFFFHPPSLSTPPHIYSSGLVEKQ